MKKLKALMCAFLCVAGMLIVPLPALALADGELAFIYDPHGARDPFLPLVTSAGTIINYDSNLVVAEMLLEGIVEGGGSKVAVINGNLVEPGQMIGYYKVQSIEEDSVVLLKDGQTSVLRLKKEE